MRTNYFNIDNIYEDIQKQNCILSFSCNNYKKDLKLNCSLNVLKELFNESLNNAEKVNIFTKYEEVSVRRLVMNTYDEGDLDYIQFYYKQEYYNITLKEAKRILMLLT